MLNTISRAGKVISLFTPTEPEWGVREAAARLGVPRSNTHDILSSLAAVGLLQRTDRGRYRLGWRLLTINRSLIYGAGFQADVFAILRETVAGLGETATIGVWDGMSAVRFASARGTRPDSAPAHGTGTRAAGHATALGKVLLASCSDAEVAALIRRWGLPSLTSHTVGDASSLWQELEQVRALGVAASVEESAIGVACVAVLVRGLDAEPIAALSISVPAQRAALARERYGPALAKAAERLTRRLSTGCDRSRVRVPA